VNTGPGIPEEHQAPIFWQFDQFDTLNTAAKAGTGFGLAIAKQSSTCTGWPHLGQPDARPGLDLPDGAADLRRVSHGVP
jgi:hypothetical protein